MSGGALVEGGGGPGSLLHTVLLLHTGGQGGRAEMRGEKVGQAVEKATFKFES